MATDPIRDAITTFAEDLAELIRAAVVDDIRVALSVADAPRSPKTRPTEASSEDAWPISGTNAHRVLEALRTRRDGMALAELMTAIGLGRKPLGKAIDKLRARGRVRTKGGRGRPGMRYFASTANDA